MKFVRGYCTHQKFGSFRIPVPLQNIILRDFAKKNKFGFKLSTNEFYFENCYMQLLRLVNVSIEEKIHGIVMMSYTMLPKNRTELISIVKELMINNINLYFIIENLKIENESHFKEFINIINLKSEIKIS